MDRLYSWNAKRAGGRITVTHSCGKIANIDTIQPERVEWPERVDDEPHHRTAIVATAADGRKYELVVA